MADKPQVVKLAQAGIDVKTAGDEHLVYNSNWPLLKIYKSGSFTTSDTTSANQLITNHDLGYTPAFWYFANSNITDWYTLTGVPTRRSEFNGPSGSLTINPNKLALTPYDIIFSGSTMFEYYILALDITKPYTAPQIKSGGVIGPRNNNTVFKLAKPSKDVSSNRLEDFIINSEARSPMIHAVYPGVTGSDTSIQGGIGFTYYHNLGYVPMFFAYGATHDTNGNAVVGPSNASPDSYILLTPDGSGGSGIVVDETKIQYFHPTRNIKVTLVILKDPFSVDFSISVSI